MSTNRAYVGETAVHSISHSREDVEAARLILAGAAEKPRFVPSPKNAFRTPRSTEGGPQPAGEAPGIGGGAQPFPKGLSRGPTKPFADDDPTSFAGGDEDVCSECGQRKQPDAGSQHLARPRR